jgi:mannose-1-phosphate guanylyltransferase
VVVTPSDQTVTDVAGYTEAIRQAIRMAAEGDIVILGILPDRPETGYGYMRPMARTCGSPSRAHPVPRVTSMPAGTTGTVACSCCGSGRYLGKDDIVHFEDIYGRPCEQEIAPDGNERSDHSRPACDL